MMYMYDPDGCGLKHAIGCINTINNIQSMMCEETLWELHIITVLDQSTVHVITRVLYFYTRLLCTLLYPDVSTVSAAVVPIHINNTEV